MTIPYLFPWDTVLSPLAMDVGQPDFFSEGGHKKNILQDSENARKHMLELKVLPLLGCPRNLVTG